MKYKVGDKVKIRKDLEIGDYYDRLCWLDGMQEDLAGKVVTIENSAGCGHWYLKESGYIISEEMIERKVINMKEQIVKFKKENIAVNCKTQKEYNEFMKLCEKHNIKWRSGSKATRFDGWNTYKDEFCVAYDYYKGEKCLGLGNINYYKSNGWKVIEYKDFIKGRKVEEVKNKFKVGDLVKGISNEYRVTDKNMTKGEVIKVFNDKEIEVKVLKHKTRPEEKDFTYRVESKYFELIKSKSFTKANLKVGDVLTLRNGWRVYISESDAFLNVENGEHGKGELSTVNEDLTDNFGSKYDIMKVERPIGKVIYEREEQEEILDEAEKRYLQGVIRPFRDEVVYIEKCPFREKEYIHIDTNDSMIDFPNFEKGSMYKGMELKKKYSIEELGL